MHRREDRVDLTPDIIMESNAEAVGTKSCCIICSEIRREIWFSLELVGSFIIHNHLVN